MPPARASRCSFSCQQLEDGSVTKLVPLLHTAASICHALRSICAERDSRVLYFADENGSDEAVPMLCKSYFKSFFGNVKAFNFKKLKL